MMVDNELEEQEDLEPTEDDLRELELLQETDAEKDLENTTIVTSDGTEDVTYTEEVEVDNQPPEDESTIVLECDDCGTTFAVEREGNPHNYSVYEYCPNCNRAIVRPRVI